MRKSGRRLLIAAVCFLWMVFPVGGQTWSEAGASLYAQKLRGGVTLYRQARWREAIRELTIAQDEALSAQQLSEALYWLSLAELAVSDFNAALRTMDLLEKTGGERVADSVYHRGRAFYQLGYYQEAAALFGRYAATARERERVAAAVYWIGECYLSLGQIDKARGYFQAVIGQYFDTAKYEMAVHRMSLINQKRTEQELLEMIRWSHEDTLKTSEEYQRRERMHDQALNAYQRQIAEHQQDTRLAETEYANAEYRRQLLEAQNRINSLERQVESLNSDAAEASSRAANELRAWAVQLRTTMMTALLQQPDISILHSLISRLDQYIGGGENLTDDDLAAMELTITLLKAQYNLSL
jgi:tetratricopeptide (TPR) repeat protein